jgi:hypothetical protein
VSRIEGATATSLPSSAPSLPLRPRCGRGSDNPRGGSNLAAREHIVGTVIVILQLVRASALPPTAPDRGR